jgi:hypothetical protein
MNRACCACQQIFDSRTTWQKWCSGLCRMRAFRQKLKSMNAPAIETPRKKGGTSHDLRRHHTRTL